jgi:hypothetical protein
VAYSIPPSGYLVENLGGIKCSILVSSITDTEGFFVLGDTFIRNFYVSFNYDSLTVSLAQSATPPKLTNSLGFWAIFGIVAGSVLFLAVAVSVSIFFLKKKQMCCYASRHT